MVRRKPKDVGKTKLKRFLAHLKEVRTTIDGSTGLTQSPTSSYFSAMNSFCKFLRYEGYLQENPVPAFHNRYIHDTTSSNKSKR